MDKFLLNCPETKQHKYPLYYDNITVYSSAGLLTFNYDVINNVYIKPPFSLFVDIQRCKGKENPDSCIKFANFKTSRLCNLLVSTKEFWSPMITCARPKFGCPMAKGIYRGRNCTLDMSGFNWFPLGDSYWKLKVQLAVQSNNMIACGLVEGQYTKY
ncbi:uncharacterized protein [Atheta coriaria]|uniref:uncharacterized protein n=1 Tax=Dalotia coriaria TaxID=877792 RepID=UPI0031F4262D